MALEHEMQQRDFTVVTLVDRTGQGGGELIHDGIRLPIKPEFHVPAFLARWLFGTHITQQRVHTTDGQYVCRLGIKDGPEELLSQLGAEAFDVSPIEVAPHVAEGWDTAAIDPARATTMRAQHITVPPAELHARQGGGRRVETWGGR